MYKDYFRFSELPFSIAPDPRFLFMSDRHREALAHLCYGVQGEGGIVLLTGEIGTGKTTLCRCMLEQLPENIDVAFILNPLMRARELLQTICEEYHIDVRPERPGTKQLIDAIYAHLLDSNGRGRRAILVIDEAQNLNPLVLEQLRLLTNLETNSRKLLQIILIGQPELQTLLATPGMKQVAQRVIARYHLTHLSLPEVRAYVGHRLNVAGAFPGIFPDALIKKLYQVSGGIPRVINLVCDRSLLGAYVQGQQQVSASTLREAAGEVMAAQQPRQGRWALAAGLSALVLATAAASAVVAFKLGEAKPLAATRDEASVEVAAPAAGALASTATVFPTPAEPSPAPPAIAAAELPVTPAPAPAKSERVLSQLAWPEKAARPSSESVAFDALFKLYGITGGGPAKGSPCQRAEAQGMRCYSAKGGLSDLFLLDQPAVMRLASPDRGEYFATLTSLDRQTATLWFAGAEQVIALADLANAWSGDFTLIWRAPPEFRSQLSLSERGRAVDWLRRSLAAIDGSPDDGSGVFNAELARRVRSFQLAEGIRPDGYVGPLTAIRINVRSGQAGPLLSGGRKG